MEWEAAEVGRGGGLPLARLLSVEDHPSLNPSPSTGREIGMMAYIEKCGTPRSAPPSLRVAAKRRVIGNATIYKM